MITFALPFHSRLTAALLLSAIPLCSYARLGETVDQTYERYGHQSGKLGYNGGGCNMLPSGISDGSYTATMTHAQFMIKTFALHNEAFSDTWVYANRFDIKCWFHHDIVTKIEYKIDRQTLSLGPNGYSRPIGFTEKEIASIMEAESGGKAWHKTLSGDYRTTWANALGYAADWDGEALVFSWPAKDSQFDAVDLEVNRISSEERALARERARRDDQARQLKEADSKVPAF